MNKQPYEAAPRSKNGSDHRQQDVLADKHNRDLAEAQKPSIPALPWQPTQATLERPVPISGANLAGRIAVGPHQPPHPTANLQDRVYWVASLEVQGNWVKVTGHDGKVMLLSPSVVAWLA